MLSLTASQPGKSVLVIEDEGLIALDLKRQLESHGYQVPAVGATAEDAVQLAEKFLPDLILMDIMLRGGADGINAANNVRRKLDVPIIFVTAHADTKTIERATLAEPCGFVVKPFGIAELKVQIEIAHHKHQAERKVRESQSSLKATLNSVREGVIVVDACSRIEFLNSAAEELTGWPVAEAIGRALAEVFQISTLNSADAAELDFTHSGGVPREYQIVSRSGSLSTIQCAIAPSPNSRGVSGAIVTFSDIAARKDLEAKVKQNSKSEAIAVMASSLAHDFNNMLMVVLGYVDLLQSKPDRRCPELEQIRKAGEVAATLARQLLTVSRKSSGDREIVDLNAVVSAAEKMICQIVGDRCTLYCDLAPAPLLIQANHTQIIQILVNLAANARDAMPRGGVFRVATRGTPTAVELLVSDTGQGMSLETRQRIFEPFFSLKGHRGTGLGMTIVHNLVTQWGGTIDVQSEPGKGTVFQIQLPAETGGLPAPESPLTLPPADPPAGTIMLVDDNDDVRRLLQNEFEQGGFQVISAGSGAEALALLELHGKPVDLLVTDVMMPKMSGPQLARKCAGQSSSMAILFLSGYDADALSDDDLIRSGRAELVRKPIPGSHLIERAAYAIQRAKRGLGPK